MVHFGCRSCSNYIVYCDLGPHFGLKQSNEKLDRGMANARLAPGRFIQHQLSQTIVWHSSNTMLTTCPALATLGDAHGAQPVMAAIEEI